MLGQLGAQQAVRAANKLENMGQAPEDGGYTGGSTSSMQQMLGQLGAQQASRADRSADMEVAEGGGSAST